jgi:AbrB family looped-hinge helix DNA binding protein
MQAQLATITQKGQVTLPKFLRDSLGISLNSKVLISKSGDYIKLKAVGPDIMDLAGTFKIPKGAPGVMEAREYMEKHYKRF